MENLMEIAIGGFLTLLFALGLIVLIITLPIWIIPFIIYRKIKYGYI